METYTVLTKREYNKFKNRENVKTEEAELNFKKEPKIEELRDYYKTKSQPYDRDENCKILNKINNEIIKHPYKSYINEIKKDSNGYEFTTIYKGTKFYKALRWFYDDMNVPVDRIWVGDLSTAADYINQYYAGFLTYKTTADLRTFIINNNNLLLIVNDPSTPADIIHAIKILFGTGMTLEEKISSLNKPTFIFEKATCRKGSEKTLVSRPSVGYDLMFQKLIVEYIEKHFNVNATILVPQVSPFKNCMDQEITISIKYINIDKSDKYTWTNYGLIGIDNVRYMKPNHIRYRNINMNIVRWVDSHNKLSYNHSNILSINVHGLISILDNISIHDFVNMLTAYVNKINPSILVLQEMLIQHIHTVLSHCKFYKFYKILNGSTLNNDKNKNNLCLVVFVKYHVKPTEIKYHNFKSNLDFNKLRGSIEMNINNVKFMFIHGPIGTSYFNKNRVAGRVQFYEAYKNNMILLNNFYSGLLSKNPDVIIGDFNLLPMSDQIKMIEKHGYITDDYDNYTSINDVKVDWVLWLNNNKLKNCKTHVYNWHISDHRPIGFNYDFTYNQINKQINKPKNIKGGYDNIGNKLNSTIFIIILMIIMISIYIFNKHKTKVCNVLFILLCVLMYLRMYLRMTYIKSND